MERRRDDLVRAIGVPTTFRHVRLSTVQPTTAVAAVRKYYHAHAWKRAASEALILAGPTGTGKAVASVALISELLVDLGASQRFVIASALARRLMDFHQVDEAMASVTQIRMLVIDDLADLEPRGLALVEEVLIVRHAEDLPVVITTNLTPTRLAEMFSDRINDRLRAWGQVVECRGGSLRKRPEPTT